MTSVADVMVRDWELERYRLGELSREERERIETLLVADAGLRARLAALDVADAALFALRPPKAFAAAVRERARVADSAARAPRPRLALAWAAAGAVAILAAGVFFVSREGPEPRDGDRIKGLRPHVLLFRKTADGPERLASTSLARPHDVIQVAYQAAGRRYGVVVSVDARGVVTRHLPVVGGQAAELQPGTVALPAAYELDDAPRWECFYLVAAAAPFDVAAVADAAREASRAGAREPGQRLALPAQLDQEVFVLRKEAQP